MSPELEALRDKWPAWVELVEREGRPVDPKHRPTFERMCREMRHLELEDNGHEIKNIGNFTTIYIMFEKADPTAFNHAYRVIRHALTAKIPVPPAGEYPR